MTEELVESAKEKFGQIVEEQLARVEQLKVQTETVDHTKFNPLVIGVCFGDGIGEIISMHARHLLEHMLSAEVQEGKIVFKDIAGLTIENRAKHKKAIPDDVLEELKSCPVIP